MGDDFIITRPDVLVMYVDGEAGKPISEQAPRAFNALEAKLASLKGRKFYGVVIGDLYRACVAVEPDDGPDLLAYPTWTLPGGRFARHRIADWERHRDLIGPTFAALRARPDSDPNRPSIEFYRSQQELQVLVPVR